MYFVPGKGSVPPMLRAYTEDRADRPPPVKKKKKQKPRRVAKIKPVAKRVVKYIHRTEKWIPLHTKLREARLREEGEYVQKCLILCIKHYLPTQRKPV
jgi:hypothetical protein